MSGIDPGMVYLACPVTACGWRSAAAPSSDGHCRDLMGIAWRAHWAKHAPTPILRNPAAR